MGKNLFNKLTLMIEKLKKEKGEMVSLDEFGTAVLKEIGSDTRTYERAMFTVRKLNMIEETEMGIKLI